MTKVKDRFIVENVKDPSGSIIIIRDIGSGEEFSVLPESGGRLSDLRLSSGRIILPVLRRIENPQSRNRDDIFTNAKLSPFAGRIRDGKYDFDGRTFALPCNYPEESNACHGFVYDKPFEVSEVKVSEESARCALTYRYDGSIEGFPFAYTLRIVYELRLGKGFVCATHVTNASSQPMPLSDGWHHYIDLGLPVDELEMQLQVIETYPLDSRNIPTGERQCASEFRENRKIDSRHFDSCFRVDAKEGIARHSLALRGKNLILQLWQQAGQGQYGYLVVYTPQDRRSIAIEPMTSNINAFKSGEGKIVLPPGGTFSAECGMQLRDLTSL